MLYSTGYQEPPLIPSERAELGIASLGLNKP